MAAHDDDDGSWEPTGQVDVPLEPPTSITRRAVASPTVPPKASATAALVEITKLQGDMSTLNAEFKAHSAEDQRSLTDIKTTLSEHGGVLRDQNQVLTDLRVTTSKMETHLGLLVQERTEIKSEQKKVTEHKRSRFVTLLGQIGAPLAALIAGAFAILAAGKC